MSVTNYCISYELSKIRNVIEVIKYHNNKAVVLLHEIYGINTHIINVKNYWLRQGFDVYTPELFPHKKTYTYLQQDIAYQAFLNNTGFRPESITSLVSNLKRGYDKLIIIGYSVGATYAWLSAKQFEPDGIVCYYGSQIRHHVDSVPLCPVLTILAKKENFDVTAMHEQLISKHNVKSYLFDAAHGFCDPHCLSYDQTLSKIALKRVKNFIGGL